MSESSPMKDIIPILFLTIVVCISVTLLTLTDALTWERIEEEERKAIQEKLEEIYPGMDNYTKDDDLGIYIIIDSYAEIGVAFEVIGKGYGGDIKMIVGLDWNRSQIHDPDNKAEDAPIRGMKIVPPIQETPGLGAKIIEDDFQDQFGNITAGDVERKADGGMISDATTGATISSSAVVDGVRKTIEKKINTIKEKWEEEG